MHTFMHLLIVCSNCESSNGPTQSIDPRVQGRSQPHSPGWARVPLSSFFLKSRSIFPQTLLIFFLILPLRVGECPPGKALAALLLGSMLRGARWATPCLRMVRAYGQVFLHSSGVSPGRLGQAALKLHMPLTVAWCVCRKLEIDPCWGPGKLLNTAPRAKRNRMNHKILLSSIQNIFICLFSLRVWTVSKKTCEIARV